MKLFFIVATVFLLLGNPIETVETVIVVKENDNTENIENTEVVKNEIPMPVEKVKVKINNSTNRDKSSNVSRSSEEKELREIKVIVTAYDLSVQSCGKKKGHPLRGITKSGFDLNGMSRKEAMTISADPKVIPLGSKVKIEFLSEKYRDYEGIYMVRDVGGAIKQNRVDLYVGDFGEKVSQEAINFGRTEAVITVLED